MSVMLPLEDFTQESGSTIVNVTGGGGGSGTVTGTGVSPRIAFWSAASVLSSDSAFIYDNVGKGVELGDDSLITPYLWLRGRDSPGVGVARLFLGTQAQKTALPATFTFGYAGSVRVTGVGATVNTGVYQTISAINASDLYGGYFDALPDSAGAGGGQAYGVQGRGLVASGVTTTFGNIAGLRGIAGAQGTTANTVANASGVKAEISNSGGGTLTVAGVMAGLSMSFSAAGITTPVGVGVDIPIIGGGATMTNSYGIRIADQSGLGAGAFSIWSGGGVNVLTGPTGVGMSPSVYNFAAKGYTLLTTVGTGNIPLSIQSTSRQMINFSGFGMSPFGATNPGIGMSALDDVGIYDGTTLVASFGNRESSGLIPAQTKLYGPLSVNAVLNAATSSQEAFRLQVGCLANMANPGFACGGYLFTEPSGSSLTVAGEYNGFFVDITGNSPNVTDDYVAGRFQVNQIGQGNMAGLLVSPSVRTDSIYHPGVMIGAIVAMRDDGVTAGGANTTDMTGVLVTQHSRGTAKDSGGVNRGITIQRNNEFDYQTGTVAIASGGPPTTIVTVSGAMSMVTLDASLHLVGKRIGVLDPVSGDKKLYKITAVTDATHLVIAVPSGHPGWAGPMAYRIFGTVPWSQYLRMEGVGLAELGFGSGDATEAVIYMACEPNLGATSANALYIENPYNTTYAPTTIGVNGIFSGVNVLLKSGAYGDSGTHDLRITPDFAVAGTIAGVGGVPNLAANPARYLKVVQGSTVYAIPMYLLT